MTAASIPTISVVIPLFNKANHIRRAVLSALGQTVRDFELVVVDDGSTDGGADVARSIRDPRIRLVSQENAGAGSARNRGIAEARADLIAFLDADDEWLPEHLATIKRLSENHPECGAYATAYEEVDRGPRRWCREYAHIPPAPWEGVVPSYFRSTPILTSAVAVPKRVFDAVGLFSGRRTPGEDLVMWCQIALAYPIAFSTRVTVVYHREAENSLSRGQGVLEEPGEIRIIRAALATGRFPAGIARTDLVDYGNLRLIDRALHNVRHGFRREARALLHQVQATRTHRAQVRRWMLLSYLPAPLLRFALSVRQSVGSTGRCAGDDESRNHAARTGEVD